MSTRSGLLHGPYAPRIGRAGGLLCLFFWPAAQPAGAADPPRPPVLTPAQRAHRQSLYEKLFGTRARLDPATVERVKALPPGERLPLDSDGDGRVDEAWFIDPDPAHQAPFKPILVRAVDEDGDLPEDGQPDLDSDLYLADWHADGAVDVAVDYTDTDGDDDVDEMAIYFYNPNDRRLRRDAVRAWWMRDLDDVNRLEYTVNYWYQQTECERRSRFTGNGLIVSFALEEDGPRWLPFFENPFLFYDTDGDGDAEMALRFHGVGGEVRSLRYSFDADNDAGEASPTDYDFSLNAWGPGLLDEEMRPRLQLPPDLTETAALRGIASAPFLAWRHAKAFAEKAPWARVMLCWDEDDNNIDFRDPARPEPHERWEGVIAAGSEQFPQIGGPASGALNKRFEIDLDGSGGMRLYFSWTDHRIHLRGADLGWLRCDLDYDGTADAAWRYSDTDKDGVIDRWEFDRDGDGTFDRAWEAAGGAPLDVPFDPAAIARLYRGALDRLAFADAMSLLSLRGLAGEDFAKPCPYDPESVRREWPGWPAGGIGRKLAGSREAERLFHEVAIERLGARAVAAGTIAGGILEMWERGDRIRAMNDLNAARSGRGIALPPLGSDVKLDFQWPEAATEPLPVVLTSRDDTLRALLDLPSPAFQARRLRAPRAVPVQADDLDGDGRRDEMAMLLGPWSADGLSARIVPVEAGTDPARTAVAQDWLPPNIGWESEATAYRMYHGAMDFFGKKRPELILPGLGADEARGGVSYHTESDWGMDVLHVGASSGIGGLSIWEGDRRVPVMNPKGQGDVKIDRRPVAQGPVRAGVRAVFSNVAGAKGAYRVRVLYLIYAGRAETELRVMVEEAPGGTEEIVLGPGFTRLAHDRSFLAADEGVFGVWGREQGPIGEIGMAAAFDPRRFAGTAEGETDRFVKLRAKRGEEVRFWIVGGWRRGARYPIAPTAADFERDVRALAAKLRAPTAATAGRTGE